jgi:hypothetical protein
VFFIAAIAAAHPLKALVSHSEEARRAAVPVIVPSPLAARLGFAGDALLAADIYWLKALQYFGDSRNHDKARDNQSFEKLSPMLELVTDLDPRDCVVYRAAGLMLTSSERFDLATADKLLERGLQPCGDDWYIPFVLAFNKYYFEWKPDEAGRLMSLAAQRPEAPEFLGDLAVRLLSHVGDLDAAEAMLGTLLETTRDDALKAATQKRLQRVRTERILRDLDNGQQQFTARASRPATSLQELQAAGLAAPNLADPSGGTLYFDKAGRAQTSAYDNRLELRDHAIPKEIH